jgi:hypothetical protein
VKAEVTDDLLDALAAYITALTASADSTHRTADRVLYERHLAVAARMFAAAHRDSTGRALQGLIDEERRSYGRSYLSDSEGDRTESAFHALAEFVARNPGKT